MSGTIREEQAGDGEAIRALTLNGELCEDLQFKSLGAPIPVVTIAYARGYAADS